MISYSLHHVFSYQYKGIYQDKQYSKYARAGWESTHDEISSRIGSGAELHASTNHNHVEIMMQ